MRIHKGMQICGLDVVPLRRFVRSLGFWGGFNADDLQRELGLDKAATTRAMTALRKGGYIKRHPESSVGGKKWGVTLELGALAAASLTKPISRERLEELLQGVIDRAEANNANPNRAADVDSIAIFGSYWRKQHDYGDLDLVIETRANKAWLAANWAMVWNLNPRGDLVRASITDMPPESADLRRVWTAARGRLKRPVRVSPRR